MAPSRLSCISTRCVTTSQQPWRGSSTWETEPTYMSNIITDIKVWKIWSAGGLSIILSLKPTRTSANVDHQSSPSIRNKIIQNIPAVMKYKIRVTITQKVNITSPLAHVSSLLTNEILVPNGSKAQDQQNLHYQCIQCSEESIDISYSSP